MNSLSAFFKWGAPKEDNDENKNNFNWGLQEELLLNILQFLPNESPIKSAELVCKSWCLAGRNIECVKAKEELEETFIKILEIAESNLDQNHDKDLIEIYNNLKTHFKKGLQKLFPGEMNVIFKNLTDTKETLNFKMLSFLFSHIYETLKEKPKYAEQIIQSLQSINKQEKNHSGISSVLDMLAKNRLNPKKTNLYSTSWCESNQLDVIFSIMLQTQDQALRENAISVLADDGYIAFELRGEVPSIFHSSKTRDAVMEFAQQLPDTVPEKEEFLIYLGFLFAKFSDRENAKQILKEIDKMTNDGDRLLKVLFDHVNFDYIEEDSNLEVGIELMLLLLIEEEYTMFDQQKILDCLNYCLDRWVSNQSVMKIEKPIEIALLLLKYDLYSNEFLFKILSQHHYHDTLNYLGSLPNSEEKERFFEQLNAETKREENSCIIS